MATQPPNQGSLPLGQTAAAGDTVTAGRRSRPASSELSLAMRHAEVLVEGLRGEMRGEITALTASVRESDTRRSADIDKLTHSLSTVPKLDDIKRSNRNAIIAISTIFVASLALLWTVFGVGASITGGIADRVIQSRQTQNDLLQTQKQILLELKNERKSGGGPVQPTPQGNAIGNHS